MATATKASTKSAARSLRIVTRPSAWLTIFRASSEGALLILTTDRGRSLRGVVITKPGGHVVRARSSSTVFSEIPVSKSALTLHVFRQASEFAEPTKADHPVVKAFHARGRHNLGSEAHRNLPLVVENTKHEV